MSDKPTRLTESRLRAGLNLRPAAELLDLTPRELSDRENGRANPSDEEWERMFHKLSNASNTGAA